MVAHQRHGAALARAGHDVLGVRAAADHVAQRPQLLGAMGLRGAEHRVERVGMRMRVGEHGHDHHPLLARAVADPPVDPGR